MIDRNALPNGIRKLAMSLDRLGPAGGTPEGPERANHELEKFMQHLALKEGINVNDMRHYRNKGMRRGFAHVRETGWDVAKYFVGGIAAQLIHKLAGNVIGGMNSAGAKIPKFVQTASFFIPAIALRRYSGLVNENRAVLDAARVVDRVWKDPVARQQLIDAVRDNNTGELDRLQKDKDHGPVFKTIRKWLPRTLAGLSGIGVAASGYEGLASFITTLYLRPDLMPAALANLPVKGVSEVGKMGVEIGGHLKDGAMGIWGFISKFIR
ncbi:MAG: hypothetical protein G01um10148_1057 [Parcubacteria group bacterium Gr01-1014_8]|nr:MAG: hypothetical protein G01um10148_1057 [Parcubacteria group bacterium Gr01-1014_8]